MINLRENFCWGKIRTLSLCAVLMGSEIWDLNDLTILLLTAEEFQTEQGEKNTNLSRGYEPLAS